MSPIHIAFAALGFGLAAFFWIACIAGAREDEATARFDPTRGKLILTRGDMLRHPHAPADVDQMQLAFGDICSRGGIRAYPRPVHDRVSP